MRELELAMSNSGSGALATLIAVMEAKFPNYAPAWTRAGEVFGQGWEREFDDVIRRLLGRDEKEYQKAVDGYAAFCTDALRSQIFFERNGHFKASSHADVSAECYHNPQFMFESYLPGLLLSHFVWPHHYRMLRWFREQISAIHVSTFAEVGTGCGLYSAEALRAFPQARGMGYDISAHALEFTSRVVNALGSAERYGTNVRDVVAAPAPKVDLMICQEVLEHLEDPAEMCRALFAMTRPRGHAYITAAINAGHVDHIYLYRSIDQVLDHIVAAGFEIVASHSELAYGGKPLELTPCVGGALVRRIV